MNRRQRGLTLIEMILAIMLMGLVTAVLSQAFAVGIDSYQRGRRAIRGLNQIQTAGHTMVDAFRSVVPSGGKIKLEAARAGSTLNIVRYSRSGLEENGFAVTEKGGASKLEFRREIPVKDRLDAGGNIFPLAQDVRGIEIIFTGNVGRTQDRSPTGTASPDTAPRLAEFKIRTKDGRIFESAAFSRIDPESLLADSKSPPDT